MVETTTRRRTAKKAPGKAVAKAASTAVMTIDELIDQGRKALLNIIALEDSPRDQYELLADTLIALRQKFESPGKGFPDWRGRSQAYREAASRVYAEADIPPDSQGSIQARIRYVIDGRLREIAPAKQLEELGYKKRNAAERQKDRRDAQKARGRALDVEGPTLTAGNAPITTRAEAYRAIRMVLEDTVMVLPMPAEDDEAGYIECMGELVATAKLMEQLWAMHERRRSIRRNTIELASTYAATVTRRPQTKEELAAIRSETSSEARYLSQPRERAAQLEVIEPEALTA